jgi:hypothetical protein
MKKFKETCAEEKSGADTCLSIVYSLRGGRAEYCMDQLDLNHIAAKLRSILPILFLRNHLFTRADGQEENKEESTCKR